jgi:hypothetical protein
MLYSGATGGKG